MDSGVSGDSGQAVVGPVKPESRTPRDIVTTQSMYYLLNHGVLVFCVINWKRKVRTEARFD